MLILASASPRRKELLKLITDDFIAISSNIDESINTDITPFEIPVNLATQKALNVSKIYKEDTIIGADTVIVFNNEIYGKPKDYNDAKRMLKLFSNNDHYVVTGVCVVNNSKTISFSSITKVTFFPLSENEIEVYLNNENYLDKAGSYAIQDKGCLFVKEITGDYFNVVGLPVSKLNKILKDFFNI